ncbi:Programmed cell death toxin MazF [hydrothermal vent metagenome]|uniref:Programmed cell death toxin MazF n=1 Tax=hydrothermal vent metagenome TaxID=652676 RepID=A0A1W1E2D6_9ZZZZ
MDYIPKKGDLITLNFTPQSGHEQRGRRPALVISHYNFNKRLGLCVVCPITHTDRKIPFHIQIKNKKLTGFAMSEQVKSIDFVSRKISFVDVASDKVLQKVVNMVGNIID